MKFEGYLKKPKSNDKFWPVEIPALGIHTQGKSLKHALEMAKDAIETTIDRHNFTVTIQLLDDSSFSIEANDPRPLIALLLRRQRQAKGLTLMEVAKRLRSTSPNSYGRYEQGRVMPSLDKLTQLLKAIDDDLEPILRFKKAN